MTSLGQLGYRLGSSDVGRTLLVGVDDRLATYELVVHAWTSQGGECQVSPRPSATTKPRRTGRSSARRTPIRAPRAANAGRRSIDADLDATDATPTARPAPGTPATPTDAGSVMSADPSARRATDDEALPMATERADCSRRDGGDPRGSTLERDDERPRSLRCYSPRAWSGVHRE